MTIDLASLVTDPDFASTFTLTRLTETVDTHGRATNTSEDLPMFGMILPATDEQLERLEEADQTSEVLAVYCTTLLSTDGDIIIWKNEQYEVFQVQDWMDTAGFCVGLVRNTEELGDA